MMNFMTYILWFSLTCGFNQLESGTDGPQFQLEYHDFVTAWVEDLTERKVEVRHVDKESLEFLTGLPMEKRIDLCYAAKKFVGVALDVTSRRITDVPIKIYERHRLVLQCETLPVAYLEKGWWLKENEWKIWINTNKMTEKHDFEVERNISEPSLTATTVWEDPLYIDVSAPAFDGFIRSFEALLVVKSHIFSSFIPTDHLSLCLAAKEKILQGEDIPVHQVPVMLSKEVESPQVYNFGSMKRVALKCPSAPAMYIYFKAPRVDEEEVQVVLLATDEHPEPESTTLTLF